MVNPPAGAQLQLLLLRPQASPPQQLQGTITASSSRSYSFRPVDRLCLLISLVPIPAAIRPAAVLGLQNPNRIDASPSLVSIVTLALFLSLTTLSLASSFPSSVPWRAALYFLWALYEGPLRSFRLPFSFPCCLHASLHSLLRLLLSALCGLCDCRLNPALNRFDSCHSFYFYFFLSLSFYLIISGFLSLHLSLFFIFFFINISSRSCLR